MKTLSLYQKILVVLLIIFMVVTDLLFNIDELYQYWIVLFMITMIIGVLLIMSFK